MGGKRHKRKRRGKYEGIGVNCEVCQFAYSPVMVVHHMRPIAHGGDNTRENRIWLCPNCHAVVHHFKNILGRNFFGGTQIARDQSFSGKIAMISGNLKDTYLPDQLELLWQLAEETYRRPDKDER